MSNGVFKNSSAYEFKYDRFDESINILKKRLTSHLGNDSFELLVSIKNLQREIKTHEQEIKVICNYKILFFVSCIHFFVYCALRFAVGILCLYC